MPSALRADLLRRLRRYLIGSNRYQPLYTINCGIYRVLGRIVKNAYARLPGVKAVYLAHGQAIGELYPGLSDFDVAIVYDASRAAELYPRLRARWRRIQRFVSARDLLLFTTREFTLWQGMGGGWEPLDELQHWKLVHGRDLRRSRFSLEGPQARRDRLRFALSKYHDLSRTILKEEPKSPYLAVTARRNLYKFFCYSVLSLERRYLALGRQRERLASWIRDGGGAARPAVELLGMQRRRFHHGEISNFRFSVGALAYGALDARLRHTDGHFHAGAEDFPHVATPIPPENLDEVEARMRGFADNVAELLGDRITSIVLASSGSAYGYLCLIILKDGLAAEAVQDTLRTLHEVFRIYDDAWFDEHFPARCPLVYSRGLYAAHLEAWPLERGCHLLHRRVLHGDDPYCGLARLPGPTDWSGEVARETLNLSRFLHQVRLEKLKPALHEALTFLFPRLYVAHRTGALATTTEEALAGYEELAGGGDACRPRAFLERHRHENVHELQRTISDDEFARVHAFLTDECSGLLKADGQPGGASR